MRLKSKVFTFVNRVVSIKESSDKTIVNYGLNDQLPTEIISQLNESLTGNACIEALSQYTFADGFVNEDLGKTKVNENQTFNQLLSELVNTVSIYNGLALYVTRFTNGKIASVKKVPFANVRKTPTGEIVINPTYGTSKYDKSKNEFFPPFRGSEISTDELASHLEKYGQDKGEILYFYKKKEGQNYYPIPSWYAGISDVNADAENSKFELESVNNSFLPSGFMTLVGDIDDKQEDENGNTEWDYYEETLANFTGNNKDEHGESGRQKLAVFNAKTKDEIPFFQAMDNTSVFNAIEQSSKRVAEKVARAFGVPPFIIGLGGNVGFSTQIISDNISLFNNRVKINQNIISEALNLIFPNVDFSITLLNPVKYIPSEVLAKLTDAELREIGGYKTLETKENSTVTLAKTLGVGGTQSLVSIIQDTILTPEQKVNTLVVLFGLDELTAKKLVLTTPQLPS